MRYAEAKRKGKAALMQETACDIAHGRDLIKKYRVECKSYSGGPEFALSSVSVIRLHIRFMTVRSALCAHVDRVVSGYGDTRIRRIFGPPSPPRPQHTVYSSLGIAIVLQF